MNDAPEINIRLDATDMEQAAAPYVLKWMTRDSEEWSRLGANIEQEFQSLIDATKSKPDQHVRDTWTGQWARSNRLTPEFLAPANKAGALEWGERILISGAASHPRTRILCLSRSIEALAPSSVLEIGSGDGLNLFALAGAHPDIAFSGLELTQSGVEAAKACRDGQAPPNHLIDYSPDPVRDRTAYRRIAFRQGNAADMPFEEGEFDLVISCVALEQMNAIKERVLREIQYVTKDWVVMIEPFRDFNDTPMRAEYCDAHDYFDARVDDLKTFGLKPVFVSTDMPQKLAYWTTWVIAKTV